MKEQRSASQVQFGFLPKQTVDLNRKVWKVREWINPIPRPVDSTALRRELIRTCAPWAANGTDGGLVASLRAQRDIQLLSVDKEAGVRVDPFPQTWMCRNCYRMHEQLGTCQCGSKEMGQLPFVGYCADCGALKEPHIPTCKAHGAVRVRLPGTSSAGEIVFDCPECGRILRKGFGTPKCQCGKGVIRFNVHRSAAVYTPRTVVVVNPPSPEVMRRLTQAGGRSRALNWVLGGMAERRVEDVGLTRETLIDTLLSQGLSRATAELAADAAAKDLSEMSPVRLSDEALQPALDDAETIALAFAESRTRIQDLSRGYESWSELGVLYHDEYPASLRRAGFDSVELIDTFPVLTGSFGFTRGNSMPGQSRLVAFESQRGTIQVFGDIAKTEALFFKLDPERVARWLESRSHKLPTWNDARSARHAVLESVQVPIPGEVADPDNPGTLLLSLIHSLSHRLIRQLAVVAGIDRNALSELLVPLHLGFFVYASVRGEFVLGGLQAVFETELHRAVYELVDAEHRCALDPGCTLAGAACMACLHIGEPSCRYFNSYLDRTVLAGEHGWFRFEPTADSTKR